MFNKFKRKIEIETIRKCIDILDECRDYKLDAIEQYKSRIKHAMICDGFAEGDRWYEIFKKANAEIDGIDLIKERLRIELSTKYNV